MYKHSRIVIFLLATHLLFACNKDKNDQFCKIDRMTFQTLKDVSGVVVYSAKYKRYGLDINIINSQNIDSKITGLVCDLDNTYKNIGTAVKITGTLKYFNSNENITPEIGGQSLYYLEVIQLTK